jgi:ABC-type phosphate transport system auxiliary subunit
MTSAENVLQTVQKFFQDVVAPDVRELKIRVKVLDEKLNALDAKMDLQFKTLSDKMDLQFQTLMSAISESKLLGEISALRATGPLAERVARIEEREKQQ